MIINVELDKEIIFTIDCIKFAVRYSNNHLILAYIPVDDDCIRHLNLDYSCVIHNA